jgi:tetratricopeptide (TPR) repeat protein
MESAVPRYINSPEYYKDKAFLFLDISGFTPLCDRYIQESSYGAEKIGDLVNGVFNPIIDYIYECGGDVISFAGDAIFAAVDKNKSEDVKNKAEEVIKQQKFDRNLSIKPEVFEGNYFPYSVNSDKASVFCFTKDVLKKTRLRNDPFPAEIYDIFRSNFKGELRAVPVFFIHIDSKFGIEKVSPLLEYLAENSREKAVYINKIEYLDKGWMILLTAGSPVYTSQAPVKIFDLLSGFSKKAKKLNIPVQIGGTLQRGYCGIIGNDNRWEFTFLGSNVNFAARIAFSAKDYIITCDSSFAYSAGTSLRSRSIGVKNYKGVGEREVFEVTGKLKVKKNIFVGRENEVRSCLDFFSGDRRALVILNGPSGIGKTMLAENIIKTLGYKNLIRLKGVYGADEPEYLFKDSDFFKGLNSAQIFRKFRSITEPALIFIDDIHFADEKSLFTFHRMINEGCPFVNFILTSIGKEKIKITPLCYYETLELDIKPFAAKDIQAVTKAVSGINIPIKTCKELLRTTKGNPLFISGILPYLNNENDHSGKIPYSLQEVILLKLNQIPGKGPEFVDGGSVYGDIFDRSVMKEVVEISENVLKKIVHKAETEGLVRRSQARDEMEFSNTIIREIIYEKMLKKKIDFFRIKIAESIITSGTKDTKKLYKALTLFFMAGDERSPGLVLKNSDVFIKSGQHDMLRNILVRSFEFMKKKGNYDQAYDQIKLISGIKTFNTGSELTSLIENAALRVKDWRNDEISILDIAKMVFFAQFKAPEELLEMYRKIKGDDKYYLWVRARTMAYIRKPEDTEKDLYSVKDSFTSTDKIKFYIDFVWFAFFITGNLKMEKEGLRVLSRLEAKMPDDIKVNFLLLKNTIAMHRDDMNESERLLDEVNRIKDLDPEVMFNLLNDYAIVYSNKAYDLADPEYMKKSLKYSEKAVKLLKDYQMISELPLVSTNLASFYMNSGRLKKAKRTYLEGLYYGQEIGHPVEVPYTKSRIAFTALTIGAYKLALKISGEVINSGVGDIKSAAYTIRYLYGKGGKKDLKIAYDLSKRYEEFGTGKCWWEMLGIMSSKAIFDNDRSQMKQIREKLISLRKLPQRQVMKFNNETGIEILGVLTGSKSDSDKLKGRIDKLEKLGVNRGLLSRSLYALGSLSNDTGMLIKARNIALETRSYPFVLCIEKELFRLTGDNYWSGRIRTSEKRLDRIDKISSIEELLK